MGSHPCSPLQPLSLQAHKAAQDGRNREAQDRLFRRYHPEVTSSSRTSADHTGIFYTKVVKKSRDAYRANLTSEYIKTQKSGYRGTPGTHFREQRASA